MTILLTRNPNDQGPVVRRMVSANHWLSSIKINRLSWYLTLVSANQASSNSAQFFKGWLVPVIGSTVSSRVVTVTANQDSSNSEESFRTNVASYLRIGFISLSPISKGKFCFFSFNAFCKASNTYIHTYIHTYFIDFPFRGFSKTIQ